MSAPLRRIFKGLVDFTKRAYKILAMILMSHSLTGVVLMQLFHFPLNAMNALRIIVKMNVIAST